MSAQPSGLVRDMPAAQYHAAPGVSNSMLSALNISPYHCWAQYLDPARLPSEPTAAMRAGSAAHSYILEPHTFAAHYIVRPAGLDGRTKEGNAWAEQVQRDNLTPLTSEQFATLEQQADAVMRSPDLRALLAGRGVAESSVFWRDADTGLQCRARPDWLLLDDGIVMDLKTAADVSNRGFTSSALKYGYHRQAAHYSRGVKAATGVTVKRFIFAVVSSSFPFVAVPYEMDPDFLSLGHDEIDGLMQQFASCQASGDWPAYTGGVQTLTLPAWAQPSQEVEFTYV